MLLELGFAVFTGYFLPPALPLIISSEVCDQAVMETTLDFISALPVWTNFLCYYLTDYC